MRRLPLIVVGSVLVVVALAFAGILLVGRGSTPVEPALAPITVQPQGSAEATPAPEQPPTGDGGTVPPPPARDADSDDEDDPDEPDDEPDDDLADDDD